MKAILVLDMPNDCDDCPLNAHTDYDFDICWVDKKSKGVCPLKPMPEKMRTDADDIEEDSYIQGWNECLEEVEK